MVLDAETVVDIMSERDHARKTVLHRRSSREIRVREIMTSEVHYMRPDQNIEYCAALMTHKRIRHLPALENDQLVVVIRIGDVVKEFIAESESTIRHPKDCITGGH